MRTYKFLIQIIAYTCLSMTFLPSCSLLSDEGDSIFDKNGNIIYDIQTDSRLTGIWANVYFGEKEEYSEDMLIFGRGNILFPSADFAKMLERDISRCREWRESAAEGRAEIDARLKKLEGLYDETCRRLRSH